MNGDTIRGNKCNYNYLKKSRFYNIYFFITFSSRCYYTYIRLRSNRMINASTLYIFPTRQLRSYHPATLCLRCNIQEPRSPYFGSLLGAPDARKSAKQDATVGGVLLTRVRTRQEPEMIVGVPALR